MMPTGLKTKEVVVGNNKYTIVLFNAKKSLSIQIKLAKILGSILPSLVSLETKKTSGKKISDTELEKIIASALQEVLSLNDEKEKEIFDLALNLLSSTRINRDGVLLSLEDDNNLDLAFSGNVNEMWRVVVEVIKANFFSQGTIKI